MKKGYRLYLVNYEVKTIKEGQVQEVPYNVRESLAGLLCHPSIGLKGYKFYEHGKLGDKIINCSEDYIILSQIEYDMLKNTIDDFKGFSRNDSELVRRIYEAEQIDLDKGSE